MIYVTGDTHKDYDIRKLSEEFFPQQEFMTKSDYVIICGDFGLVWNGDSTEKHWLKWLQERKFTMLWVDGNHENFNLLNSYPVSEWNGGKVHFINDSVIHLMRGQVFIINGLKFFTFGGADSIDKHRRIENVSWWRDEMPSNAEYEEGLRNLEKNNWLVDYIITHDCSKRVFEQLMKGLWVKDLTSINKYFEILEEKLDYRQWYFGHYHDDRQVDTKHRLLYEQIIRI